MKLTIELPDTAPLICLFRFAREIGCDLKLVSEKHFRLTPTEHPGGNVVSIPRRTANGSAPTPPGAA